MPPHAPRPVELWVGLGYGDAVCDHEKPESDCAVAGGTSLALGGAWRASRRFSLGLELGATSYRVRDAWRGKLDDAATKVELSSAALVLLGRYHFVAEERVDAHLELGLGASNVRGHAENAGGQYDVRVTGAAYALGVGAGYRLAPWVRLGPEAVAYLQKSSRVCEESTGKDMSCRAATKDQDALPWRVLLVGTFMFGSP